MALRDSSIWGELVSRLEDEHLADLAREYDLEADELEVELGASTGSGPVTEAPWWPEAVRRVESGGSIRAIARSFDTNPRRIRRGLARAGVRSPGAEGAQAGSGLEAFKERLGQEPDGIIAKEAGVTVEVVQGERRRLGIEPFRPVAQEVQAAAEELQASAPEEAPKAPRAAPKAAPAPAPREASGPAPASSAPERSTRKRRYAASPPQVIRRPLSSSRRELPRMGTSTVKAADASELGLPPRPSGDLPGLPSLDTQPRRERRGRTRLVRNDEHDHEAIAEEPKATPTRRRVRKVKPLYGEVRVVAPSEIDMASLARELDEGTPAVVPVKAESPAAPGPAEVPSAAAAAPSAVEPAPEEVPTMKAPARVPAAKKSRPKVAPAPAAARRKRPVAHPVPSPEPEPIVPVEVARPTPAAHAAAAKDLPPEVVEAISQGLELLDENTLFGWQVEVGGAVQPYLIVAQSWQQALAKASERLTSAELRIASIRPVGPLLGPLPEGLGV